MNLPVLLPLLLGHQTAGGLDTVISYSQPAKGVTALLDDLTKASHVTLKANREASREVLLISVQALPLKELMNKIAFVSSCEWESEGDGYTLVPSLTVRNRESSEAIAKRTETVRKEIQEKISQVAKAEAAQKAEEAKAKAEAAKAEAEAAKTNKDAKSTKGGTAEDEDSKPDTEDINEAMAGDSDAKVIAQLLEHLDPAVLAQVQPGTRGVWASNNATQTQILLAGETLQIVTDWISEHNQEFADGTPEVEDADAKKAMEAMPKEIRDMMKIKTSPVTEAPYKVILIATVMPLGTTIQLQAKVFGKTGNVLLSAESNLGTSLMSAMMNIANGKKSQDSSGTQPTTSTPIPYSDSSKQLLELVDSQTSNSKRKVAPELKSKLINPEVNDPLSFMASDVYLAVSKHMHRQLVADIPDETFGGKISFLSETEPMDTIEQAEAGLKAHRVVQSSDDGQFLYIRPSEPAEARAHRVDRHALKILLQNTESKLLPDLDDLADFSLQAEDPMRNSLELSYLSIACPSIAFQMFMGGGQSSWSLYRFYGSLDQSQRQSLRAGGSITFASMNAAEQGYCAEYLFGPDASIQDEGKPASQDPFLGLMKSFMGQTGTGPDYRDEPTEVMPNGLPSGGSVSCSAVSEPIAFCVEDGNMLSNLAFGPQELAFFRFATQQSKNSGSSMGLPKHALLGNRIDLNLSFHVAPKLAAQGELRDPFVDKAASQISLTNLPSDFEALVAAKTDALKKSSLGSMITIGESAAAGSVVPPL